MGTFDASWMRPLTVRPARPGPRSSSTGTISVSRASAHLMCGKGRRATRNSCRAMSADFPAARAECHEATAETRAGSLPTTLMTCCTSMRSSPSATTIRTRLCTIQQDRLVEGASGEAGKVIEATGVAGNRRRPGCARWPPRAEPLALVCFLAPRRHAQGATAGRRPDRPIATAGSALRDADCRRRRVAGPGGRRNRRAATTRVRGFQSAPGGRKRATDWGCWVGTSAFGRGGSG